MLNLIAGATMAITVVFQPYIFTNPVTGEILNAEIDRFETVEQCEADGEHYTRVAEDNGMRFQYHCLAVEFEVDIPGRDS